MGAASVLDPLASGFTKLDSGQRGVPNHATATPHRTVPHCEDEAEQDGGPINTRVGSQSFDDKQHEISTFYDELLRLERSVTNGETAARKIELHSVAPHMFKCWKR